MKGMVERRRAAANTQRKGSALLTRHRVHANAREPVVVMRDHHHLHTNNRVAHAMRRQGRTKELHPLRERTISSPAASDDASATLKVFAPTFDNRNG